MTFLYKDIRDENLHGYKYALHFENGAIIFKHNINDTIELHNNLLKYKQTIENFTDDFQLVYKISELCKYISLHHNESYVNVLEKFKNIYDELTVH